MLKIIQAGEAGKTKYLFDMHKLRKRVFSDRMKWPVDVSLEELEIDQFDLPQTVYLLALDDNDRVIGNWRLLPTSGPTMIRDAWPEFLDTISMPADHNVWEASRFAVDSLADDSTKGLAQVNRATAELFCGLTELSLLCGIREIYTLYDRRIARLLRRLHCAAHTTSAQIKIGQDLAVVGAFATDENMLATLRAATGITQSLLTPNMLPPILHSFYLLQQAQHQKIAKSMAA